MSVGGLMLLLKSEKRVGMLYKNAGGVRSSRLCWVLCFIYVVIGENDVGKVFRYSLFTIRYTLLSVAGLSGEFSKKIYRRADGDRNFCRC